MPMKFLTKAILAALPPIGATEKQADPTIVCKFFAPWTNWTWYVLEGSPEGGDTNDMRFYGYIEGQANEIGYFMLNELLAVRGPFGLKIERDLHWTPKPLSAVWKVSPN